LYFEILCDGDESGLKPAWIGLGWVKVAHFCRFGGTKWFKSRVFWFKNAVK
jgi:hypothetical protein